MSNTDGERVIEFLQSFCRYTRGRNAGQLIAVREWQREIVRDLYRVVDGKREYRLGLLGEPRKNGKSMLGAGLALYGLMADGEEGAEVYSCAGDKEQAKIVFNEAKQMVKSDPHLSSALTVMRDEIIHEPTWSRYKALSAEAYTKEGLNPSLVIFDEVHVQPNEDLWNVMTLGSGARERPLVLGITTAGYDKDTLCGRLYDMGKAGTIPGFFFRWFEPVRQDCDYRDEAVWAEANPGLGDFLSIEDFRLAVRQTSENAFRRYRLNQWTSSLEAWLPHGAWDDRATKTARRLTPGAECCLGFDGSFSGDSTGLVACTPDAFVQLLGAWEKPGGVEGQGWTVDIAAVENAIRDACKTYAVREVAMDPYRWQRTMQVLEGEGIPVVAWPTGSPARMVPATAAFYDAIVRDRRLTHDGSPELARHVANTMVKTDNKGPRIVKEHKMSSKKIDLAVCAVIAYDRAVRPADDNGPSVF